MISRPFSPWLCHYTAMLFLFLILNHVKKIFRESNGDNQAKKKSLQIHGVEDAKEVTNA